MGVTVREMLGRIDSRELSEWVAYASIEPFGEKRQDLRFAKLAGTIVEVVKAAVGAKGEPSKIEDFMLKFDPPKQQSVDNMKARLRAISG